MPRYVVLRRPAADDEWRSDWEEPRAERVSVTVVEPELEAVKTGLLDAQGNELARLPERKPVGFLARWRE